MSHPSSPEAIQRVLFISSSVHVYQIPPLTSTKGYLAASWTANDSARQIFTARLRILETAIPLPNGTGESLSTDILLEDPSTGDLFAGAPYAETSVVEAALDSSRFFAIRVQGEGGRKAVLGIGFEERGEAIDFGIALQEARKTWRAETRGNQGGKEVENAKQPVKTEFRLKEGEMIHVDLGMKGRNRRDVELQKDEKTEVKALLSIAAPLPPNIEKDGARGMPFLPPPPSAQGMKAERRRSRQDVLPAEKSPADLGFDDGEFGEFQ